MIPEENAGNAGENETMISTACDHSFIHLFSIGHRVVNKLDSVSAFILYANEVNRQKTN